MTRITLQADSLLAALPTLLPASPLVLLSQHEAVAALLHTIHTTLGFQLIAVDEGSAPIDGDTNVLPPQWNARGPEFTLKYRHPESPTAALTIKVLKLGNRTLIHGSKDEVGSFRALFGLRLMLLSPKTDADASFEFSTPTYVSLSYFPSSIESEPLVHAFVSGERLEEFVAEYLNRIVKGLTPEISLESAQPSETSVSSPPRLLFWADAD
jgi:proteasome inhibitor subunit 1 (PI31)